MIFYLWFLVLNSLVLITNSRSGLNWVKKVLTMFSETRHFPILTFLIVNCYMFVLYYVICLYCIMFVLYYGCNVLCLYCIMRRKKVVFKESCKIHGSLTKNNKENVKVASFKLYCLLKCCFVCFRFLIFSISLFHIQMLLFINSRAENLEWWISTLMLDPLFFLILRLT